MPRIFSVKHAVPEYPPTEIANPAISLLAAFLK